MQKYKNQIAIDIFNESAVCYGGKGAPYFDYFGRQIVQKSKIKKGSHALDVACGLGAISIPLSSAVGNSGKVIAIDLAKEMILKLKRKLDAHPISCLEPKVMDAEHLNFPDNSFDAVFCGFAIFFFPKPQTAVAEIKRVLKPKGKVYFTVWGEMPQITLRTLKECDLIRPKQNIAANAIKNSEKMEKILSANGFHEIRISSEKKAFSYSIQEWWQGLWHQGTRSYLSHLTEKESQVIYKKAAQLIKAEFPTEKFTEVFESFYIEARL